MPPTRWTGRSVARLRVRWTKDPDDKAAPGEALARLVPVGDSHRTRRGQGAVAQAIAVSGTTGEASWSGQPKRTDLHARRLTMQMSVETSDGRRLVGHFAPDAAAPRIDSDSDADLLDAFNRAWRAEPTKGMPGQPSEQAARIAAIIDMAADMLDTATRLTVAQALGRVKKSDWPEASSHFKDDVRAAGGWAEVMRKARARK